MSILSKILQKKARITGGGGSGMYSITRPTMTEVLYNAIIMISLQHDGQIRSHKNRYWDSEGNMSLEESINTMSRMLAYNIFRGTREMFQEGLSREIEKSIKRTIHKYHTEGGE